MYYIIATCWFDSIIFLLATVSKTGTGKSESANLAHGRNSQKQQQKAHVIVHVLLLPKYRRKGGPRQIKRIDQVYALNRQFVTHQGMKSFPKLPVPKDLTLTPTT
jgi:hypothetical protein